MKPKGLLIVVSGPSGAGKGTICKALRNLKQDVYYSISATTRKPRVNEVDGQHYFFVAKEKFEDMIANNELLEWAKVYDNYYGTPRKVVMEKLEQGQDIILEIDIQGAMQVKEKFPQGVFVFIAPPSLEILRNRLINRGTDDLPVIEKRLSFTREELSHIKEYDYLIVNDELDSSARRLHAIIIAEKCKPERVDYEIN